MTIGNPQVLALARSRSFPANLFANTLRFDFMNTLPPIALAHWNYEHNSRQGHCKVAANEQVNQSSLQIVENASEENVASARTRVRKCRP
jgi:hypothetical protein